MKAGEVVLARFLGADLAAAKKRPAEICIHFNPAHSGASSVPLSAPCASFTSIEPAMRVGVDAVIVSVPLVASTFFAV